MPGLLLYCVKAKPYLQVNRCVLPTEYDRYILSKEQYYSPFGEPLDKLNGKIVAECDFEVEEIKNKLTNNNSHLELFTNHLSEEELFNKSCLSRYEMFNYLKNGFSKKEEPKGYAIHINNLHIFDEPKELSETYENACDKCKENQELCLFCPHYYDVRQTIINAPQNMRYCYFEGKNYILISIQPQWMCLILNRIKDVEVRKVVLKEMLDNGK